MLRVKEDNQGSIYCNHHIKEEATDSVKAGMQSSTGTVASIHSLAKDDWQIKWNFGKDTGSSKTNGVGGKDTATQSPKDYVNVGQYLGIDDKNKKQVEKNANKKPVRRGAEILIAGNPRQSAATFYSSY